MHLRLLLGFALCPLLITLAGAQEIVKFDRDIQPILTAKCLKCHGPDDAKNDYRVDDAETMSYYIEAGDAESSSLWTDYLITEDHDMIMPPISDENPSGLSPSELALIKVWIDEGAKHEWKTATPADEEEVVEIVVAKPLSTFEKVWLFQGYFHPASTHFPVALLSISVVFLLFSYFGGKTFESAAYFCLWFGALGAVAACIMGWAYAVDEGYMGVNFSLDKAIDRHRWMGILVAAGALLLIPVARVTVLSETSRLRTVWLICSVLVGLGVSLVGYQGGELIHGEDHYMKEFNRLFQIAVVEEIVEEAIEEAPDEQPAEEAGEPEESAEESS